MPIPACAVASFFCRPYHYGHLREKVAEFTKDMFIPGNVSYMIYLLYYVYDVHIVSDANRARELAFG